jgi:hypothetical protein
MNLNLEEFRRRLFEQPRPKAVSSPTPGAVSPKFNSSGRSSSATATTRVEPLVLQAGEAISVAMETAKREDAVTALPSQAREAPPSTSRDKVLSEPRSAFAQLFEGTEHIQRRLDDLHQRLGQIESTCRSRDELFAPLRLFYTRLSQLAQAFASMRAFEFELAQMAETFEPMNVLHDGLAQLADSFEDHLAQLVHSLDSARRFGERLRGLAHTFDQAEQLQEEFLELRSAFRTAAG